jgi:hypothetical protein
MTTIHIGAGPARRRLILALGRGKSGKTIWARWLTEAMRARGINPGVVDADTDDVGLCRYEEGVARLRGHDGEEVAWWNAVLADSEDRSGRPVVVDCSHNPGVIDRVHSEATGFRDRDFRDRYCGDRLRRHQGVLLCAGYGRCRCIRQQWGAGNGDRHVAGIE